MRWLLLPCRRLVGRLSPRTGFAIPSDACGKGPCLYAAFDLDHSGPEGCTRPQPEVGAVLRATGQRQISGGEAHERVSFGVDSLVRIDSPGEARSNRVVARQNGAEGTEPDDMLTAHQPTG